MKKLPLLVILILFLTGCATVNFSSKYYDLPSDYKGDIQKIWDDNISKVPLNNSYSYKICKDNETETPGIPQIEETVISIPDYFIRYIYEFYYNDRSAILTCIICHEIAHTEYNYAWDTPESHYFTDKAAIDNILSHTLYNANHLYSSLKVLRDYWSARKGVVGHLCNIGWNTLNLFSLLYGGAYCFMDWYATDINTRMNLIINDYSPVYFVFTRSK